MLEIKSELGKNEQNLMRVKCSHLHNVKIKILHIIVSNFVNLHFEFSTFVRWFFICYTMLITSFVLVATYYEQQYGKGHVVRKIYSFQYFQRLLKYKYLIN